MKSATRVSWTVPALELESRRINPQSRTCVGWTTAIVIAIGLGACAADDTSDNVPRAGSGSGVSGVGVATSGTAAPSAGATAAGAGGGATGATFTAVLALFGPPKNCNICHASAPSTLNGGLQFNPADKAGAHAALVGKMSAGTNGSMCAGKTYVVPNQPTSSLLYQKLTATPPCGLRMPSGLPPLSDTEMQTVSSWIMAGAKND